MLPKITAKMIYDIALENGWGTVIGLPQEEMNWGPSVSDKEWASMLEDAEDMLDGDDVDANPTNS